MKVILFLFEFLNEKLNFTPSPMKIQISPILLAFLFTQKESILIRHTSQTALKNIPFRVEAAIYNWELLN
jgi:hypothetical protein